MEIKKHICDYGINIGEMSPGSFNSIADVKGVTVGHCTLTDGKIQTGVTAIIPHNGNIFKDKVVAASHVINGFTKSIGLLQIEEMGVIETPILLTNTLSIGVACNSLIEYMLQQNHDIGKTTNTINPVVLECNDGFLNDIRTPNIKKEHVMSALNNASQKFKEGSVGAGTGMSCFKLKGGIGSSSRKIDLNTTYHIGALVLSNMGQICDLTIQGNNIGQQIYKRISNMDTSQDVGSIIIILATDAPLNERQLKRVAKRTSVGLARTGSFMGTGSGEIVVAFSTQNIVEHYEKEQVKSYQRIHENYIDYFFRATAEATEEAIINSMITSPTIIGRDGLIRRSLRDFEDLIKQGGKT